MPHFVWLPELSSLITFKPSLLGLTPSVSHGSWYQSLLRSPLGLWSLLLPTWSPQPSAAPRRSHAGVSPFLSLSAPQESFPQTAVTPLIGLAWLLPASLTLKLLWNTPSLPQPQLPHWRPRPPSSADVILPPWTHTSVRVTIDTQHIIHMGLFTNLAFGVMVI